MSDGERSAAAVATVAFFIGAFFRFHWDAAAMLCAVWVVGLLIVYGGGDEA